MNSVERVKRLCKQRRVPIARLERELKFSNGYIGQLRKGVLPYERAVAIAEYFGVTPDYLLTGEETKKEPAPEGVELTELQKEAVEFVLSLSNEQLRQLMRVGQAMIEK